MRVVYITDTPTKIADSINEEIKLLEGHGERVLDVKFAVTENGLWPVHALILYERV